MFTEVRLSRNGWHRKLQKLVFFGNPPTFQSFCPYFWITIFCIIVTFIFPIIPVIYAFASLYLGIAWLSKKILGFFNNVICEPLFAAIADRMPEEELAKAWAWDTCKDGSYFWSEEFYKWKPEEQEEFRFWTHKYRSNFYDELDYKKRDKMINKFQVWKKRNPDWKEKMEKIKARQKEEWAKYLERLQKEREEAFQLRLRKEERARLKREEASKKEEKRRKTFLAIVKYTKYPAYAIGIAILLVAGYGMYTLGNWIYNTVNWVSFFRILQDILKVASLILIAGVGVVSVVMAIGALIRKCEISVVEIPGVRPFIGFLRTVAIYVFRGFLLPVGLFLGKAARWSWSGLRFIWMYVVAIKENNCPAIVWEEEKSK